MLRSVQFSIAYVALCACSEDSATDRVIDGGGADGRVIDGGGADGRVIDGGGADGSVGIDARTDGASDVVRDAGPGCGLPNKFTFQFEGGPLSVGGWSYELRFRTLQKVGPSSAFPDAGSASCTIELGCDVPSIVDGRELEVFFLADVRNAFTTDDTLFGVDPRSAGGDLLVIEMLGLTGLPTGKKLRIGSPCGAAASCTPIPTGVEALRKTLVTLVDENRPPSVGVDGGIPGDSCDQT